MCFSVVLVQRARCCEVPLQKPCGFVLRLGQKQVNSSVKVWFLSAVPPLKDFKNSRFPISCHFIGPEQKQSRTQGGLLFQNPV